MGTQGDIPLRVESLLRRAGLSDVPRPLLAAVAVLCLALVLLAAWRFWPGVSESDDFAVGGASAAQQATAASADTSVQNDSASSSGASAGEGEAQSLTVDVEGEVRGPGLKTLPAGSRVGDAVEAAGGLTAKAQRRTVNLAEKLADGAQVYVYAKGEGQVAAGSGSAGASGAAQGASAGTEKVNLNTATVEELQTLSGIGPALSERIVDYREEHGGFESVEELKEVSGIGDVRFASLEESVCV